MNYSLNFEIHSMVYYLEKMLFSASLFQYVWFLNTKPLINLYRKQIFTHIDLMGQKDMLINL